MFGIGKNRRNVKGRVVWFVGEEYYNRDDWACNPHIKLADGWGSAVEDKAMAENAARKIFLESNGEIRTVVLQAEVVWKPSVQ